MYSIFFISKIHFFLYQKFIFFIYEILKIFLDIKLSNLWYQTIEFRKYFLISNIKFMISNIKFMISNNRILISRNWFFNAAVVPSVRVWVRPCVDLVNTIETKPWHISLSNFTDMLTMMRGWTLLILEVRGQRSRSQWRYIEISLWTR